ncbi:hypothetical protein A0128_14345 [Leptospira tipperaryensis]|uniref:Uncharacterized protein n=1 Tax=Leptospira tipperaryensis TaxID=2564040 RepID=A0A1D7UZB4_9LEPT|nr:hypothetical protein [Leptospira tipperaryensis]AOP34921.1 hypothetical protein A0128_14345 [Leptospira tipperaryensis]
MKIEYSQERMKLAPEELQVSTGTLSMVSRLLFPGSLLTAYRNHHSEIVSEEKIPLEENTD